MKHDAFILRVVQTNCTKPMFLITDLLIVFLACLVRNKIQVNNAHQFNGNPLLQ